MTADLAALSTRFMEAVRDRELEWLEQHLGAEFTLTTGRTGAPLRGRAEWLAITGGRYVIDEFSFDDLEVMDYGEVAVVRSRYRQRGAMDEADRSQAYLMTDVWVERDGRPQLVTRHVSPLRADPEGEFGDRPPAGICPQRAAAGSSSTPVPSPASDRVAAAV